MNESDLERRVLVLAPVGRDAALLARVLEDARMKPSTCTDADELSRALREGASSVLMTEEALTPEIVTALLDAADAQPAWSDVPLVLLADPEPLVTDHRRCVAALADTASLTVIERPVRVLPLVSAMRAALRARARQYEIRDLVQSEHAAREEAELASRVKDEFLATVSHELRTPLSAILLWTRLLRTGALDDAKVQQALQSIERSAEAQSKLVEDLLDVSRMISGKLQLHLERVAFEPLATAALDIVRPAADAKRIDVEAAIAPDAIVWGDAARIQQIVWNLLSNAVKFTPAGGRVSLRVSRAGAKVRIEVSDTGKGINPAFLPSVFDRFRQADGTISRREGGLGLGLAITRELVDLHGGTIRAYSAGSGQGATFSIELPAVDVATTTADRTGEQPDHATSLEGVRVLVAEDDTDTREALVLTLQRSGADVIDVASARAALDVLASARSERPNVLVSDLGLPGMNGYELLRRVRDLELERGEDAMPAALISAYAGARDRQTSHEAGFAAHLAKPLEPTELVATLARLAAPCSRTQGG
jgi:signal transduction histidine kinase/CheY-like chemotaxis protein